jgi:hypothetical protein
MARFDKVDSTIGVFRVPAAAAADEANYDRVIGVSVNAAGKGVLKAAGQTGFKGVTTVDRTKRKAGDILDVMTNGEIVECEGLVAGQNYYLSAAGELQTGVTQHYVGHTVEADRLVVRFESKGTYA